MKNLAIAVSVLCISVTAHAAKSKGQNTSSPKVAVQETSEALGLPLAERISRLRDQGPQGYRNLVGIMFNEKATMNARWKAVTAAGRIGGKDARPEIERALKHNVWYMRNAGLVAMRTVDREASRTWARKLLSDKALVVRASAVDVLNELGDRTSAPLLWKKLDAAENFKGGQSLYIRQRIVETLARIESTGKEAAFIRLLNDKDESLHAPAMQGLERLTKQSVGPADGDVAERRSAWLKWWKTRNG